jgi:hypothetical protein
MTPTAALALLAAFAIPGAHPLPADPFQRDAYQVVVLGMYDAAPWQVSAYKRGMAQGVTANKRIWLTGYYATEGSSGRTDCKGRRCTMRTAAANRVRQGGSVWTPWGIRDVRDTGAHSNDHYADRKGADLWADYWYATPGACPFGGSTITTGAVIR